jgi:hypothetical protein
MTHDTWSNCYPSNWKGLIVPEAIAHPAKFSSKLIRRIYEHMKSEGWVKAGDTVIDPFGGVALGSLDAMRLGLKWRGIELEPRFADLGNANIAEWNRRFSTMPGWSGDAVLLNGDSRELATVLDKAAACVSSPPYADKEITKQRNFMGGHSKSGTPAAGIRNIDKGYSAAVSSPPFTERQPTSNARPGEEIELRQMPVDTYGSTPGQLGAMKANGFDAAVSSPPFEKTEGRLSSGKFKNPEESARIRSENRRNGKTKGHYASPNAILRSMNKANQEVYGDTAGQLGNDSGDDFWSAARTIVDQVYSVLAPGGHAVWVCKDFVKNKQIVPFCSQWRTLCEAAGFTTLHEHHALLVHSTEHDFDGKEKRRESKSFFRRLAENKGSPRIDYETVFCMVKNNVA